MTSTIDPTMPTAPHAYTAQVQGEFSHAKNDIEQLQGAQVVSGSGTGMVFSRAGTVRFPQIGDGTTNVATQLNNYWTSLQGSRKTLLIDDGDYLFGSVLASISGFFIEMSACARLIATARAGLGISLTGSSACGIFGGEIQNRTMKRYQIASITQAGGSGTAITVQTTEDNDFGVSDSLYLQGVVMTSGTLNGASQTVATKPQPDTFTLSGSGLDIADATAYPYDQGDGSGVFITPAVYRARSSAFADTLLYVDSSNWQIEGTKLRWSAVNGLSVVGASRGLTRGIQIIETAADGLHITSQANNIRFIDTEIIGTNDDGVGMVGYCANGGPIQSVEFDGLHIRDQYYNGRGMAILGASDIKIKRLSIEQSYSAGMLIGRDTSYDTYPTKRVSVDGFRLKTCGRTTVPTGWSNVVQDAIFFSGDDTSEIGRSRNIRFRNGEILNSRRSACDYTAGYAVDELSFEDVTADESARFGLVFSGRNGSAKRIVSRNSSSYGVLVNGACKGVNWIDDVVLGNPAVNTRYSLQSVSVSGGTITYTIKGDQTSVFTGALSHVLRGVGSAYASASTPGAEVAKDLAINGTWTLASSSYSGGTELTTCTITGTGLSDTNHARVVTAGQARPEAYAALASGASADGLFADTGISGHTRISRVRLVEKAHALDRAFDCHANSLPFVLIDDYFDSTSEASGISFTIGERGKRRFVSISADSAQTISASDIVNSGIVRTGLSTGRTDTTATAAEIIACRGSNLGGDVWTFSYVNDSSQTVTFAGGANVTIATGGSIANNTENVYSITTTPSTVTFTLLFSRTIV